MRGEQRLGAKLFRVGAEFEHRAGDAHAVEGRRAAADLVENEQGLGRCLMQDLAHLGHLDHEGRLAAGQVVARADAREDAVDNADARRARGHERADLRHERDERDLAHIGRFTGHVGAGDDGGAILALAHVGVVRDKERVFEHALDDRVAAVVNFDNAAVVHAGAAVVVVHRNGRERAERIKLGNEPRRALDAHALGGHLVAQGGEEFKFERLVAVARGQDLLLEILELFGDVALAVHERLLADVRLGHELLEGVRNLDIVAKDLVIADLERADAGFFLLARLDARKQSLAAGENFVQPIDLGVVAGADEAALAHGKRRLVDERFADAPGNVRERIKLAVQLVQAACRKG